MIRNTKIWPALPILVLILIAVPTMSTANEKALTLDEVLFHLRTREQTLETFSADFRQIQRSELFEKPQTSEGRLYFDRSGKLLMKMTLPETFFVFLTGRKMISGTPDSPYRQKTLPGSNPFFKQILGIGQSVDQLKKQFNIQLTSTATRQGCEIEFQTLRKNRRMPFVSIQATINTQLWLPETVRLQESGGDITVFYLTFTAINEPLPDGIFDIESANSHPAEPSGSHEAK
jgi:outer membrane lipoprotein-sorting protein